MDGTTPGLIEAEAAPIESEPASSERSTAEAAVLATDRLAVGRATVVRADDPWAEAGRKILRFHLARMLVRVPGVVAGEDAEEVHAMRVAARRMRAAWRVFGDGFERDETRAYRSELRDIGARLGAVRDLDVLIEMLVTYGEHRSARQRVGLEPLLAAWRSEREARRVDLLATLGADRFTTFISDYETFAETPGHAALVLPPHVPGLVRNRMPTTIWGAYQRVWAFDDGIGTADLATLHQLRIAGKWLRYTLEFVREPLEPGVTALIRPIVALQDHLGSQHDQHVAGLLAREFLTSRTLTDAQAKSIGKFIDHLDQGVERLGRSFGSTWRPIAASSYRRALGRAIARL